MMMYQEEYEMFTGDDAMTYGEMGSYPFEKFRAVEVTTGEWSLFSSEQQYYSTNVDLHDHTNLFQSVKSIPTSFPKVTPSVRCPEKPCFTLAHTSFHTHECQFDKVKESVEKALDSMDGYDWSYFEQDCMWKVKYFQGSNLREKYVYCYWDSKVEDHLIEVKRVRGDGIVNVSATGDFLAKLKSVVTNTEEELPHLKRRNLRAPLPINFSNTTSNVVTAETSSPSMNCAPKLALPKLTRGGGGGVPLRPLPMANFKPAELTNEQFLSGIKPILSMAFDQFYEPRLEAAKMLCDLATKEKKYLELEECQELCLKTLDSLLFDEFEEVRQFAVMAFASFVELECYRSLFLRLRGLESLIALIRNSPREYPAYQTAQMRRKAALGISLIAGSHSKEIKQSLVNVGYETEQSWMDHCCTILDKRTRESAMKIGGVFK